MEKTLLVIPGTGDANHPKYAKVYEFYKNMLTNLIMKM